MTGCTLLLLLFGQILPIAHGHVLPVLARIEALLDADGLEVSLPQLLKKAFVLVQQTVVQAAGGKVWQVVRLVEGDAAKVRQIVVETIGAAHVVDQPALVGKAVAEVGHNQRQGLVHALQCIGEGAAGVGLENGCQKAGKGVVELEDGHGNEE